MNIKPIKTQKDYTNALKRMEILWGSKLGTPAGNELDILATLIDKYEETHFPIEVPNAIEALKYIIEEKGVDRKELAKAIGNKSKVSEILNNKRDLSKRMIRSLHDIYDIPYEVLMA